MAQNIFKQTWDDLKNQWKTQKISTIFMAGVLILALLTFLKPSTTSTIYTFLQIQAFVLIYLGIIIAVILFFLKKKRVINF